MRVHDVFVTGVDTGIGKTFASCALLLGLRTRGLRAVGMKPIASGCRATSFGLRNEDAEALIAASDPVPPYADCNPFAFADPIAPHLAARDARVDIRLEIAHGAYARLAQTSDRVVVEGVGGWAVPLSDTLMQADLVRDFGLPVILVVGLRLGCLNHALLSARAIERDGCRLVGWIANHLDPTMDRAEDNVATLRVRIDAPLIGVLDYVPGGSAVPAARQLDVRAL